MAEAALFALFECSEVCAKRMECDEYSKGVVLMFKGRTVLGSFLGTRRGGARLVFAGGEKPMLDFFFAAAAGVLPAACGFADVSGADLRAFEAVGRFAEPLAAAAAVLDDEVVAERRE